MSYSAVDVAKHMVTYCSQKSTPISNLKLQKMLYYAWIDYFKETRQVLFSENICAWQFGPVVPEVYYEFCMYAGRPIYQEFPASIETSDAEVLNRIIDRYRSIPANELVELSHKAGGAWDSVFQNGAGLRAVIPFSLIMSLECDWNRC